MFGRPVACPPYEGRSPTAREPALPMGSERPGWEHAPPLPAPDESAIRLLARQCRRSVVELLLRTATLLERETGVRRTLLAICPNSLAVTEAAVEAARRYETPMLLAATLNQVDRDGGYTGWTPSQFMLAVSEMTRARGCAETVCVCLDHGGPWLKDAHRQGGLTYEQTMAEVRASIGECLAAGYDLLHVDPTVDAELPPGTAPDPEVVVERTLDLIAHAERERRALDRSPVAYEVGTEEVHGGLADVRSFDRFLSLLRAGLQTRGLTEAMPCFVVGKVGTDLHTTDFDAEAAKELAAIARREGCYLKGHYTDWVTQPEAYPAAGVGGANVGPELTEAEFAALAELEGQAPAADGEGITQALELAVEQSGRWTKWLLPSERGVPFRELPPDRRGWLTRSGCRYIWTAPVVREARARLCSRLAERGIDGEAVVRERIVSAIARYVAAFNLEGAGPLLARAASASIEELFG